MKLYLKTIINKLPHIKGLHQVSLKNKSVSGHTSALMLGVNEVYFDNSIDLIFIESYPTF